MSLQWSLSREVPADTAAVGQVVLKPSDIYRQIGDRFAELFPQDSEFAFMYDAHGRGAIPPLLCGLVTVFQMLENLPDRAAAEFVASRIDWKYALHLPLDYPGFHWTDLLAFRTRLWSHHQERLLYDRLLVKLQELGLIKRRGKMRSDSTHVLAVVERLSQLELVTESIRMALGALGESAAAWLVQHVPASLRELYSRSQSEYGLSQAQVKERLRQAGQDGFWLLAQLDHSAALELRQLPEVVTLRSVLGQQFPQGPHQPPASKRPTGQEVIESPHEPEARFAIKRSQGWIGYKTQVTETCDEDLPHLIVDIEPTSALANDAPQLAHIQGRLQDRDLLPSEQQVDQGYMSGEHLVKSAEKGIRLMGVPLADTQGPPDFRQTDFVIDLELQQAICPAQQVNRVWSPKADSKGGPPQILIRFAGAICQACPFFGRCTQSRQGRSLTLHPYRAALLARRAEAKTQDFQQELHLRAGIEATISELVRTHGLRHARYRTLAKQAVQVYFIAIAANLKRLARWWTHTQPASAAAAS